jgi:hypothetical protein
MLTISTEQMGIFEQDSLRQFEDEMVIHSQSFTPALSKVLGETQLRIAIHSAIKRADSYSFTNRGSIRLFIELMFLFGSDFDTDPQYPWIATILQESSPQMERAEQLYEKTLEYQDKVSGKNAINTNEALKKLPSISQQSASFSTENFPPEMLNRMAYAFPEKANFIGKKALTILIDKASTVAKHANFPTYRGYAVIVVLMYAFGHGCVNDPLYPWIYNTLKDEKIVTPKARAERLEKKAVTWLNHVLARITEGERI